MGGGLRRTKHFPGLVTIKRLQKLKEPMRALRASSSLSESVSELASSHSETVEIVSLVLHQYLAIDANPVSKVVRTGLTR